MNARTDRTKTKGAAPDQENAPFATNGKNNSAPLNRNDTSAANGRAVIVQALRTGPKTTIDLREHWGVMAPAPRILELRMRGFVIASVPVAAYTADGIRHCGVARYCLMTEPLEATRQPDSGAIASERATNARSSAGAA